MSQPPNVGPIVGPTMTPTPNSAMAMPASSGGNASNSTACDTVMSAPPPMPCTMRQKMSVPSECDAPQKNDAAVNSDDRSDEVALAAEQLAEPAGERNDDDAREDVAGRDPRDLVERRAEVPHHVGQRDVDDRAVDDLHERGEHDGERDEVAMLLTVASRRADGGCGAGLGNCVDAVVVETRGGASRVDCRVAYSRVE